MIGEDFSRNITSTPDNLSACLADSTLNMGLSFQRPISVKTFFWQGSLVSLGPRVSLSSLNSLNSIIASFILCQNVPYSHPERQSLHRKGEACMAHIQELVDSNVHLLHLHSFEGWKSSLTTRGWSTPEFWVSLWLSSQASS